MFFLAAALATLNLIPYPCSHGYIAGHTADLGSLIKLSCTSGPQLPAHQLENLTQNVFRWMKNCKTNVTQVMTLGRKAF